MTIDYIDVKETLTAKQALAHIKEVGLDSETVYTVYVMDGKRKLKGVVSLRSLVLADDDTLVSELMHTDVMSVPVTMDQEMVSNIFKRYGLLAMPVVDREDRLVGMITVDDIFDIIEDETTEDIQLMAGVTGAGDDEYLDMSVLKHVRTRLPWLFILMCSYMITGAIITKFQDMLSQVIALVSYMPLLMGTGGNSGSQSATLIIRGLSTGEVDLKDFPKVAWKEIRISLCVGACLSVLNFLRVIFIDGNSASVALTDMCGDAHHRRHSEDDRRSSADGRKSGGNRSGSHGRSGGIFADRYVFSGDLLPVRYDDSRNLTPHSKALFSVCRQSEKCRRILTAV